MNHLPTTLNLSLRPLALAVILLAVLGTSLPAAAQPSDRPLDLKVGFFMGGYYFDESFPIDREVVYGFRFGFGRFINERFLWAVDSEIVVASPFDSSDQHGFLLNTNLLGTLEWATGRIHPFIGAGYGNFEFSEFSPANDRSGQAALAALGLKFQLRPALQGRLEYRYMDFSNINDNDELEDGQYAILWGVDVFF